MDKDQWLRDFIDRNISIIPYLSILYLQDQSIPLDDRFAYAKEIHSRMQPYESTEPVKYAKPSMRPTYPVSRTTRPMNLGNELGMLSITEKAIEKKYGKPIYKPTKEKPVQEKTKCKFGKDCRDMSEEHRNETVHPCKFGRDCPLLKRNEKTHMSRYTHY